jgi:hypothetical protein
MARGTLRPVIYFTRGPEDPILLAGFDEGHPEQARKVYELKYKLEGWNWNETETLADVDRLQKRLIAQEERRIEKEGSLNQEQRERLFSDTGSRLRQIMQSSSTSPYERAFIQAWLNLRDDKKRDQYAQRLTEHNYYLWARENDSTTKIEDRV